ncbi:sensor histidine kinase [Polaribacter sp. P097]|uniref:sensor histidine kinase n=1 Tax=Polaribacter sp. P097 TaxID=3117398 RepID=UPI002FDFC20B
MKQLLFSFFLLFTVTLKAQLATDFQKIENFIIEEKLDSAVFYLNKLKDGKDKVFLKKMILKDEISYKDYYQFISNLAKRENLDFIAVANYINKEVKTPKISKGLNRDFFNIKWVLISKLRNEIHLEEANQEQLKLESYISKFKDASDNYLWASTKIQTHPLVIHLIEKNITEGKELIKKGVAIAKELEDVELEITFLSHSKGFLIYENKLEEYIATCEYILELEKQLEEKTSYYYGTITDLVNAYIYKGEDDEKVLKLIDELYNSYSKLYSYMLYAQLMSTAKEKPEIKNLILTKFNTSNVLELVKKFDELGKDLNLNEYYHLINKSSDALAEHDYFEEALQYKHKALQITRDIYSEDLTRSLTKYKNQEALKIKEEEIGLEKEQRQLYFIIALLCFALLIITFVVLRKIKDQSNELARKNKLIEISLEEKETLIKEMHHRVKNNFQIINSLLDLQTDEIKDVKALQILEKGRNRIKSMSLIHQKLFRSKSGLINFNEFVDLLVKELSYLYKLEDNLEVTANIKDIFFDIDTAIPLALVLNEIITNSFKYAFETEKNNKLEITLDKQDSQNYLLTIKDNGSGFTKDFEIEQTTSSGLKLVKRLVRQLHGKLTIINNEGVTFEIQFQDTETRKEIN